MGHRMTIQSAVVTGFEFDKNKQLRNLHGQTVTVLCGSQFYHTETEETMRIKPYEQNLICTDDNEYLVVDSKKLLTDGTYMKTGYSHYAWNPCTPEKWKELQAKKADNFTKAVDGVMNMAYRDERFDTEIGFSEKHNGYREIGYKIEPHMFEAYKESGINVDKDSAQYDICISHNYNDKQQAAVDLEKIKQIVEENAPDGISYTNVDTGWYAANPLYGKEFNIQIIAPMHHVDREPLVRQVNDYMAECVANMDFTDAVAAIPVTADDLKQ